MARHLMGLAAALLAVGTAAAQYGSPQQYPTGQPNSPLPNYYNRTTQPLSPYLNLLNSGNPALNYYYGVRPGLSNGGLSPAQQYGRQPTYPLQGGPGTSGFLPPASFTYPETDPAVDPSKAFSLPSAGGPAGFGNVFGSSRTGVPGSGSGSGFTTQMRSSGGVSGGTSGRSQTAPGSIPKAR